MDLIRRLHSGRVVILWVAGVFLQFVVVFWIERYAASGDPSRALVSNLAEIDSAQANSADASLRLEREWLLAQYPGHSWRDIVLAQARCRFAGETPAWYDCEPSAQVPEVDARIPAPDFDFLALALFLVSGALIPIGLLGVTVFWSYGSPLYAWGGTRLIGLWFSGLAALSLSVLGWMILTSETAGRFPTLSGVLFLPYLVIAVGIPALLLGLTWKWLSAGTRQKKSRAEQTNHGL